MCSLYEFIYTFRETPDAPFPDMDSEEAKRALEMINRIKDEVSSKEIFESADDKTVDRLYNNKYIFMKYWYLPSRNYAKTILPGHKKGISGTTIGGYNIGIGGYLNEERRKAAITAFQYITSEEVQKKFIMERGLFSGILRLYEDKDVCQVIDCNFFKSFQPIARPTYITNDYNTYSEKFRNSIYNYLYENGELNHSIQDIINLSKFYYIQISTNWSSLGLLFFVLSLIVIGLMLLSLSILKNSDTKIFFNFMPSELWIIVVVGCVITICSGFTGYGEVSEFKCHLKSILLSLGYSLITTPLLCKLILNNTESNGLSEWVKSKNFLFISIMIGINLITIGLSFIASIKVENVTDVTGEFFKICKLHGFGNFFLIILLFLINIVSSLWILVLAIKERGIIETLRDIKLISLAIIIDIALTITFISISNNNFNNFESYFLVNECIFFVFSLSNYILLYGFRMLCDVVRRDNVQDANIETFAGFESKVSNNELKGSNDNMKSNSKSSIELNETDEKVVKSVAAMNNV